MGKEKEIFAKVYFNGSYISSVCGKCGNSLSIDTNNGKPSDYYKFCQRCGEEVRIFQMQFAQVKKEKEAYDKGLEAGKKQGTNENIKEEINDVIGSQLKSLIQEAIEEMMPDDQDIDDLAGEITSSAKKGIFAYIFKNKLSKKNNG